MTLTDRGGLGWLSCMPRLDLPLYDSKEELEGCLSLVINMEITGFTMD
jgi:hypothetical protein